jgi:hypothetical protein
MMWDYMLGGLLFFDNNFVVTRIFLGVGSSIYSFHDSFVVTRIFLGRWEQSLYVKGMASIYLCFHCGKAMGSKVAFRSDKFPFVL